MFFRAFVIIMILLQLNNNPFWSSIFGIIVGIFSEYGEWIKRILRMFFVAFVFSSLILYAYPTAIWALPLGLLLGMCSESKYLTHHKWN